MAELHSIKMASATLRGHTPKKCRVRQLIRLRFYARNLPLSKEMAINLQSFGGSDED